MKQKQSYIKSPFVTLWAEHGEDEWESDEDLTLSRLRGPTENPQIEMHIPWFSFASPYQERDKI